MKLVTAILPTRGRRELAQQALACFMAQTYGHKELIIIDDADDPSFPEDTARWFVESGSRVQYVMLTRLSIPVKRNMACRRAKGEIIWHLDSDDWSAPERMADQVERLESSGKPVTGYHSMLFTDGVRAAKYVGYPTYAVGTSLCYLRKFWEAHPFNETLAVHEDNAFVKAAQDYQDIVSVDAGQLMVARVHDGNTDKKDLTKYRPVPLTAIPEAFFA